MKILVTGGAGFIGSHLVDRLQGAGHTVVVLDNLDPQVHRGKAPRGNLAHTDVELIVGDVRDGAAVKKALRGVEAVYHFAAAVGVGQSMYQIREYTDVNAMGAATLLQTIVDEKKELSRLIVASSMSCYGEGSTRCAKCGPSAPALRAEAQLKARQWDVACPTCGGTTTPIPTPETKPFIPSSIYAINKRDHEEMFLCIGRAYNIPAVAMRFFNVYGTRQSVSNPYTGVVAIFSSRFLNNKRPIVFEDGEQSRDFVHVSDIVQANVLALTSENAPGNVINVGTGKPSSVGQIARAIARSLGKSIEPEILGTFRAGDIRHCYADISQARRLLSYEPKVGLDTGIKELTAWLGEQEAEDMVDAARKELEKRGLAN